MYRDFVPSNIFQTSLESRVYFILCSWMCLTVWRPKVCRGWEEQHSFSLHVLVDLSVSWGAARSEGSEASWSNLKQLISSMIKYFFSKQNMLISGLASRRSHPTRCACGWPWQPWRPPKAAALLCLGFFFYGFCLRCASSIWRAPIGASGQWCHSIGSCFRWRYDGHI